jgi:ribosomal protein L32
VMAIRIMTTDEPVVLSLAPPVAIAVLSIGRLGVASGADYYLDHVANSVDDYYLGRGEAPGQWIGATSAGLRLTGMVDPVVLRNLLDGRGGAGEDLGIMRRADRRPGFDLTFSASKVCRSCGRSGRPKFVTPYLLPMTRPSPASSTTCRPRPPTSVVAKCHSPCSSVRPGPAWR